MLLYTARGTLKNKCIPEFYRVISHQYLTFKKSNPFIFLMEINSTDVEESLKVQMFFRHICHLTIMGLSVAIKNHSSIILLQTIRVHDIVFISCRLLMLSFASYFDKSFVLQFTIRRISMLLANERDLLCEVQWGMSGIDKKIYRHTLFGVHIRKVIKSPKNKK